MAPLHARLEVQDGIVWLEDVGGTLLNGAPASGASLKAGDVLQVGALRLHLRELQMPVATPASWLVRPTFGERARYELARAPWFVVSIALHALLLLLAWNLLPAPAPGDTRSLGIAFAPLAPLEPLPQAEESDLQPRAENDALVPVATAEPLAPLPQAVTPAVAPPELPAPPLTATGAQALLAHLQHVPAGGSAGGGLTGDLLASGHKALQGAFGKTVGELRRSGLELVFVVDSTGSMGQVLATARARIERMIEVLHALVPDARIGVIAFRDSGRNEEYVTRAVGLTRDVWRVINFVHTLTADGGGDREEAVREALQAAFRQPWSPGARRVVVLLGDAPPHRASVAALEREVATFASRPHSFVHTLITSPPEAGANTRDTVASFARIARAGRGTATPLEAQDTLLRQVLSLAFGTEYRRNIDEVYQLVDRRAEAIATWARDLARHPDAARVAAELRRDPVADDVVRAFAKERNAALTELLITQLGSSSLPESGRQAAAFALQRQLALDAPPVDPVRGGPPPAERLARLRAQAESLR